VKTVQSAGKTGSRRNAVIYAAAVFGVGFIIVAVWFAFSQRRAETVDRTAPSAQTTTGIPVERPATEPTVPDGDTNRAGSDVSQNPPTTNARDELRASLVDWIAATNDRAIDKLMEFYAPTVNVFYLKRNVSQSTVRAEKNSLLSQSSAIEVRAGEPDIQLTTDGQSATMRFRKSWNFNTPKRESGEVIQELGWRKTDSGWKIVSERDIEIIRISK
jgi:ketosteroid isomerase-like protein